MRSKILSPEDTLLGDPLLIDPYEGTADPVSAIEWDYEDVNRDGFLDLLLWFDLSEMRDQGAIDASTQRLWLWSDGPTNSVFDITFSGTDVVNPPKPPKKSKPPKPPKEPKPPKPPKPPKD